MLVKEVVALAAATLGRQDLERDALGVAGEPEGELASLLRCYNLIENEIALDYFPLKREETFQTPTGEILFTRFSYAPVNIVRVRDGGGADVAFELYPEKLAAQRGGALTVTYAYSPKEKKWNEACEFDGKISARLMAYGIACEFCLTRGQFQEAAAWEKRYRDCVRAANINRRKLSVRSRRWI